MYVPSHFSLEDQAEIRGFLRSTVFGHLVTTDESGLASTALPFIIDDDLTHVRAHFAKANPHWRTIDGVDSLFIVPGVDAYISPRWYPSKGEHGKVVPTWNYELVHLRGTIEIHDDPVWTRGLVEELTDRNERRLSASDGDVPWTVGDAPEDFIDGQLKAIVGVQLNITSIEAKQKLSQNRNDADRLGARQGLATSESTSSRIVADRMT